MEVYRFVNPQGNGIYQDGFFTEIGLTKMGEEIPFYQPPLYEDVRGFKWNDLKKYCCAFESPYQIVSWFRDINPLDIFIKGGQLYAFDVDADRILRGRHQCIFMKNCFNEKRLVSADEFIDLIDPVSQKMDSLISW